MIDHIKSILLDNSFVTRLLKSDDPLHENVVNYFKYFLDRGVIMYLSTIVISEYAVADDPINLLSLNSFRIVEFDYMDAKISGELYKTLKDVKNVRESVERKVIINDIKIFSQVHNRKIDAFISKDIVAFKKMYTPLKEKGLVNFSYFDLSIPLNEVTGTLF